MIPPMVSRKWWETPQAKTQIQAISGPCWKVNWVKSIEVTSSATQIVATPMHPSTQPKKHFVKSSLWPTGPGADVFRERFCRKLPALTKLILQLPIASKKAASEHRLAFFEWHPGNLTTRAKPSVTKNLRILIQFIAAKRFYPNCPATILIFQHEVFVFFAGLPFWLTLFVVSCCMYCCAKPWWFTWGRSDSTAGVRLVRRLRESCTNLSKASLSCSINPYNLVITCFNCCIRNTSQANASRTK